MSTKMKGILKGLRYISHIFEEKEQEMQIGNPTDVKHVAHIGWDGPSVDSPSWMNKFEAPGGGFQSAPLNIPDDKENPEIKWVSEDSSSRRGTRALDSPGREKHELPKPTRRRSSADNSSETGSPRKEKSRHSRRHHSKDSSESVKSNRQLQLQDGSAGSESPSRNLPDIPKKSRRKKSKELVGGGGSSVSSRLKGSSSSTTNSSPYFDPGADTGSSVRSRNSEICQTSRMKPLGREEEKENSGFS